MWVFWLLHKVARSPELVDVSLSFCRFGCHVSQLFRSIGWADLREDKMINPVPRFLADFRLLGARGGPRELGDGYRLDK